MPDDAPVVAVPTTQIAEYSATAAGLAQLRARLANTVYDVTTTKGLDIAKRDRRECVSLRTALEDRRKELKAPALERARLIDAEAKALTAEIAALEEPIDAQIKKAEAAKEVARLERERLERERVAGINQRIDWIRGRLTEAIGKPSATVREAIAMVDALPITTEIYDELVDVATQARTEVATKLRDMLTVVVENEATAARLREQQEQLAAQQRQQDEAAQRQREADAARQADLDAQQAALNKQREEQEARERAAREAAEAAERQQREAAEAEERRVREAAEATEREEQRRRDDETYQAELAREREAEAARHQAEVETYRSADAAGALAVIAAIVDDEEIDDTEARRRVGLVIEANPVIPLATVAPTPIKARRRKAA